MSLSFFFRVVVSTSQGWRMSQQQQPRPRLAPRSTRPRPHRRTTAPWPGPPPRLPPPPALLPDHPRQAPYSQVRRHPARPQGFPVHRRRVPRPASDPKSHRQTPLSRPQPPTHPQKNAPALIHRLTAQFEGCGPRCQRYSCYKPKILNPSHSVFLLL